VPEGRSRWAAFFYSVMFASSPKRTCPFARNPLREIFIPFRVIELLAIPPLADIPYVAFDVAFGGKADTAYCNAHVRF
jgi:hypothetical protein